MSKKKLSPEHRLELSEELKTRFEANMGRHKGVKWAEVYARLEANPGKLWSLAEMEKDQTTKRQLNAYTAGVNYYIENLTQAELPLEYKLLNYLPEKWSPLKTALLLKYLSFDLTGSESDVEYTTAKAFFIEEPIAFDCTPGNKMPQAKIVAIAKTIAYILPMLLCLNPFSI